MSKKLRNTDAVFHSWAHEEYPEAECGNVSYEGPKLFSYSACIAKLLGNNTVAHTTQSWSITTTGHQSSARYATHHMRSVWCRDPGASVLQNREYAKDAMEVFLLNAAHKEYKKNGEETKRSEKRRFQRLAAARRVAEQFNEYLAATDNMNVPPLEIPKDLEPMVEALVARQKAEAEAKEARRKQALEDERQRLMKARQAAEAYLKLWREHKEVEWDEHRPYLREFNPFLRLSKDGTEVETSWGATIPVADALKLWPRILGVMKAGQDITLSNSSRTLGPFPLNKIRADGSVVAGCHDIPFSEIEDIAIRLELIVLKGNA